MPVLQFNTAFFDNVNDVSCICLSVFYFEEFKSTILIKIYSVCSDDTFKLALVQRRVVLIRFSGSCTRCTRSILWKHDQFCIFDLNVVGVRKDILLYKKHSLPALPQHRFVILS